MDAPPSPDFGFDEPPTIMPTGLWEAENTKKVDDSKNEDALHTPESLTSKSPQSQDSSLVEAAVDRYYTLKGKYDKKYKNAKKKILTSETGKNKEEKIRKKLQNLRLGCINCKKSGGTIFTNKNRLLTAKCGNTEAPCGLDIQIQQGKWMLLPVAAQMSQESLEEIKADIIDLKLDLLFGLRTEEQITEQFNTDKTNYKDQTKQLHLLNGIIESENDVNIDDEEDGTPRTISIKQYLEIKNIQLQEKIVKFKAFIKNYMEELDDPQMSNQFLRQALNLYIEQIFPLMTKMRESKYAVTMMDDTEEKGLFIMKQVKTRLKNLDFEYEFGRIISDKK